MLTEHIFSKDIYIYMVYARHFSGAGPVVRNVGGVKCKPLNCLALNLQSTAAVAKLSLYSTCTWSTVSFGSVKKLKLPCRDVKQSF